MTKEAADKELQIALIGNPILYQRAQEITDITDPAIQQLARDLLGAYQSENATGMAAPQLQHSLRMMVFGVSAERARKHGYDGEISTTLLINPEVEYLSESIDMTWEACFSIPGMMGLVPRYHSIRYHGQTLDGQYISREAHGFHAYIVQHEYDHLNGILYFMRIKDFSQFGYAKEFIGRLADDYLAEFGVNFNNSVNSISSVIKQKSPDDPLLVVLFDWDNTIMASAEFLKQAYENTARHLEEEKIFLLKPIPTIATKKQEDILQELFGAENVAKVLPVFKHYYNKIFDIETLKNLKMLHGARELLERLYAADIPVGIVSNYTEAGIKQHLELRNINFDYDKFPIIGSDSPSKNKPDPEPGLLVLEKLKINPKERAVKILMIGDGINSDMLFAHNLNMYLMGFNNNSRCAGILFNSLLDGNPIFSGQEIEDFIQNDHTPDAGRRVFSGYGRLFSHINNIINPSFITPELLQMQKQTLRK